MKTCYDPTKSDFKKLFILVFCISFFTFYTSAKEKTFSVHSDTYVASDTPGTNYCNEQSVAIGTHQDIIGLIYFFIGIDDIPSGSTIDNATLKLYCTTITENSNVAISRISEGWGECSVNWNNRPGSDSPVKLSKPQSTNQWWEIDVTDIVKEWVTFGESNNGFYLEKSNSGIIMFNSSENSSNKPRLEINYTEGTFSANGNVTSTTDGYGVQSVRMDFSRVSGSGSIPNSVYTSATGDWEQDGFDVNTTYRVTPVLENHNFSPTYKNFSSSGDNVSNLNFTTATSYSVTINSNPSGAEIHLSSPEGTIIGTTPSTIDNIEGNISIYLTKDGYEPLEYSLTSEDANQTITIELTEITSLVFTPPFQNAITDHEVNELSHWGLRLLLTAPSNFDASTGKINHSSLLEMFLVGESAFYTKNSIIWSFQVPETGTYRVQFDGSLNGGIYGGGFGGLNTYKHWLYLSSKITTDIYDDSYIGRSYSDLLNTLDEELPSGFNWVSYNSFLEIGEAIAKIYKVGWIVKLVKAADLADLINSVKELISPEIHFNNESFNGDKLEYEVTLQANKDYYFEFGVNGYTLAGISSYDGGFVGAEEITASLNKVTITKINELETPQIQISPKSFIELSNVEKGNYSDNPNIFKITNVGGGQLNGEANVEYGPFSIIGSANYSLNSNESKYVSLRFSPSEVGKYTGKIVFTGGKQKERYIYASCIATNPDLVVTPIEDYNFGNVTVGDKKISETFTVINSGSGNLIGEAIVDEPFYITDGSYNLGHGESKIISVKFEPNQEGTVSKTITFSGQGTIERKINGTGIYETGSLKVNISPNEVVSVGAQWNVDGGAWKNSGATVSGLSVGNHTVSFKDISGWSTPSNKTVSISSNQTTSTTATYTQQTGSLSVTISPNDAINAGAQWNVDDGAWKNSGATVSGLSVGNHTVSFKDISGWSTPSNKTVSISSNQTASTTATYTQQTGSLSVTISPNDAINAGAQWNVDDGAWKNSGATVNGLGVGNHIVSFKSISGWNTPSNKTVTINSNQTTSTTGTYTENNSENELIWEDEFENYTSGTFPSNWVADANATNTSKNYTDNSIQKEGANSLKLFGTLGGCWGALAYHSLSVSPPYYISIDVKNGTEQLSGCHPDRASIALRKGTSWSNPARSLVDFKGDGKIYANGSDLLESYSTNTWINVIVKYELPTSNQAKTTFWVNNNLLGEYFSSTIAEENELDNLQLAVQEGTAWFDNVKIYKSLSIPTAVNSIVYESKIRIYPNPIKDQVTISIDDPNLINSVVKIINSLGSIISVHKLDSYETTINTSSLLSGFYIIQIQNSSFIYNEKITK
ncbi:Por secretion system C-terminal sorting domain-containing protein [Tangfeifania diversioriginum]|uniref:Por secretion system C-terminal sorting domain-containing protein n=1 Tax=Tangfeifania diversioriginum TaxID=1168035 RepID=A0A1M6CA42_9BACT|nr:DNRLRE domain-containing protein [Tangfeifania diversioriginum]SHI57753.1 Por secretion system C-terminal sorting domain-containing protein [Tangfeifania diversioriginum]